jgi:hypothetical protein
MKNYRFLLVITILILSEISYCDIIETGNHAVTKCIMITNIDDYSEISLIGQTENIESWNYLVTSTGCLTGGTSEWGYVYIFAVNKKYLQGKDIKKINWLEDKNAVQTNIQIHPRRDVVGDSIPIYSIEQFYKILGFTDTTVVLFKWKEITNDKNGDPLSENDYKYEGDVSKLSQKILVGINSTSYHSTFTLYPNPAQLVVSLKISNFYEGTVPVEIISFGGKILKSTTLNKSGFINDSTIPIENLPKGIYFVTIRFGAMVETQKLIIN